MKGKQVLIRHRIREIKGTFAFIEHRFLRQGFLQALSHHEILLYLFLILVSDRKGVSWYSLEKICALIHLCPQDYVVARDGLIEKDLIAFDGFVFQVLSLPPPPTESPAWPLPSRQAEHWVRCDQAALGRLVDRAFSSKSHP